MRSVHYYLFSFLALSLLFFACAPVYAATLYFGTNEARVGVGDTFAIGVFLNTERASINAVEGTVVLPTSTELVDIQRGNSVVNLWVDAPSIAGAKVHFSGLMLGGYTGNQAYLFSLVVRATQTGTLPVTVVGGSALLNDGKGTSAPFHVAALSLPVDAQKTGVQTVSPYDKNMPESFVPEIGRNETLFGGQYFLVFDTQDKISGVDHYEVVETPHEGIPESGWIRAESPYLLSDQGLHSFIYVKAIDRAGNQRISEVLPQYPILRAEWYETVWFWIVLLLLAIGVYSWRKKR